MNNLDCLSTFETPGPNISSLDFKKLKVLSEVLIKIVVLQFLFGSKVQRLCTGYSKILGMRMGKYEYSVLHFRQILLRGATHSIQLHFQFHVQTSSNCTRLSGRSVS
jgi:hypothetical protein